MAQENQQLRVAMLDPSGFTLPYDFLLLAGLGKALPGVRFVTREPRQKPAEHYPQLAGVSIDPAFYPVAERVRKKIDRASVYGPIKAAEHWFGLRRLLARARRDRLDVLHVQWLVLPPLDQRFVRKLRAAGIKTVHTVHDTKPFHGAPTAAVQVRGWLDTLKLFDALIVHTQQSAKTLEALGVDADRINVIPHGIIPLGDTEPPAPVARTYASDDPVTLLFFGLIKPYKGVDVLLEAFSKLSSVARKNVRLKIAGNPIEVSEDLQVAAKRLGIADSVDFDLRFVPDHEVPEMLTAADVMVFPYRMIDASGIFYSVLPYAKPIVASRVGVFEEYIEAGVDGLLPEAGSVSALANDLESLLGNRDQLTALADGAARRAQSVPSWDEIGEQTAALYRRLVAS